MFPYMARKQICKTSASASSLTNVQNNSSKSTSSWYCKFRNFCDYLVLEKIAKVWFFAKNKNLHLKSIQNYSYAVFTEIVIINLIFLSFVQQTQ